MNPFRIRELTASVCIAFGAGSAFALEVAPGTHEYGSSPWHNQEERVVKPWDAYSDPSCEEVSLPTLSFDSTAYGSSKPDKHSHDTVQTHFKHEEKKSYKREQYDVSKFSGYGHHSYWKPDYDHDYCPPVPVPEPQTYALLLAGLAVMTVVARRRKLAVK